MNSIKKLSNLSITSLVVLRDYINNLIYQKVTIDSWNKQLKIEELPIDYILKTKLLNLGITNMCEYKTAVNNGLRFGDDLQEKSDWAIRTFDFDQAQKRYKDNHKKHKKM